VDSVVVGCRALHVSLVARLEEDLALFQNLRQCPEV